MSRTGFYSAVPMQRRSDEFVVGLLKSSLKLRSMCEILWGSQILWDIMCERLDCQITSMHGVSLICAFTMSELKLWFMNLKSLRSYNCWTAAGVTSCFVGDGLLFLTQVLSPAALTGNLPPDFVLSAFSIKFLPISLWTFACFEPTSVGGSTEQWTSVGHKNQENFKFPEFVCWVNVCFVFWHWWSCWFM